MFDLRATLRMQVRALTERLGGVHGTAAAIEARWGDAVSPGTVSRKREGSLDFTVADVVAIEDALGVYPVTRMLARRMTETAVSAVTSAAELALQAGEIAREAGEAVAALVRASQSMKAHDDAAALKEIDEAIEALRKARIALQTRMGGGRG
ncbi:hypothetical protein [Rhodobacter lacus]|uniref:Uncharacterized protein n=1 Tax=Rhodobacter lacus TaxID=1641972 RepID=A0ABW5ABG5_9RHOB